VWVPPLPHWYTTLTCTAIHTLIRDTLAWNHHQKDFRYRVKLYSPRPQTNGSDTTCWENTREKLERSHKNETRANPYKGMTPPSTQNLKTLGLRVFFLTCCSTFSFLSNVGLRLILEYLTISSKPTSYFCGEPHLWA